MVSSGATSSGVWAAQATSTAVAPIRFAVSMSSARPPTNTICRASAPVWAAKNLAKAGDGFAHRHGLG
jgi:hypothetical protein